MKRQSPLTRDEFGLFRTLQTRWSDNDVYGHLNNVVHYLMFDTAVNGWLIEQEILDLAGGTAIFVVVDTACSYLSEITFPDKVVAGIRVGHLGDSSVRYEIALFRNDEESAAAQGHFVHVLVDRVSRRPVPLGVRERGLFAEYLR
jgi:acyl-CoA thioester hydrolase